MTLGGALALSAARDARAEAPPTIEVRTSGPIEPYPLGKAFRVEGATTDDDVVDLVFIRSAYKAFGVWDPVSLDCSKLTEKVQVNGRFPAFAANAPVGATNVGALWPGADEKLGSSFSAYRAAPWKKTDAPAAKTFSLLVPADPFFRGGAHYCSLLLRQNRPPIIVQNVEKALATFSEKWALCAALAPQAKGSDCVDASNELGKMLSEQLGGDTLSKEEKAKLDAAVAKAKGGLADARDAREALQGSAGGWGSVFRQPAPKANEALYYFDVQTDPLGKAVAAMLARHHALLVAPDPATKGLTYYTDDGQIEVTDLAFTEKLAKIVVRGKEGLAAAAKPAPLPAKKADPAPTKERPRVTRELGVTPSTLALPGIDLKLVDLLELARGRIFVDSTYLTPEEALQKKLGAALPRNALQADAKAVKALLDPTILWLDRIESVLRAASPGKPAGAAPGPHADPGAGVVHRALGSWLSGVLADCKDVDSGARAHADDVPCVDPKAKTPNPSPLWPGYAEPAAPAGAAPTAADVGPVTYLQAKLIEYSGAAASAREGLEQLAKGTGLLRTQATASAAQRLEITAESWFGQYVVTTVGFANVMGADKPFWVNYYGFKLYPFPNRVDEPKSLVSTGLHRLLALELAFVPNLQALESAPRFNGLQKGAVPPLLAGISLQPLPFLTVSGGFIFMDSRRTVLDVETSSTFISPYLAIAADVNILDAAATGLQKGRNTTLSGLTP